MVVAKDKDPKPEDVAEGKGRPTRTRKEAEAARRRPLVPNDRKEAKRIAKEKRDEAWARQQEALKTGDERYLPPRDKGPIRRYARDWVDARWSFSEWLLPAMLLFLVGMLTISFLPFSAQVQGVIVWALTILFYGLLLISLAEGVVVWWRMKQRLQKLYPNDPIPKGTWFYVYSRMLMIPRWRSPKPQVARGELPQPKTKNQSRPRPQS